MATPPAHELYHPKDTITRTIKGAVGTGTVGLFVSAVQNALSRQRPNAWGVFTRTGSTAAVFFFMGGLYDFGRCSTANLRQKDSAINNAVGGAMAGGVLGVAFGSPAAVLGYGALCSVVLGAFDYTGGSLTGYKRPEGQDEFQSYQDMRTNRRRPIEETISQVGEGRGVYAPGYQERRRERLKAKYGIDVPADV